MQPYVMAEDLYRFKLALILGRGKRLKSILKKYPTEKKFKDASSEEIGKVLGIKNPNSGILKKLKNLDTTYDKMVTFSPDSGLSKCPRASKIMGIDTEYLKSSLDCIQYVILDDLDYVTAGFIFTNENLGSAVSITKGVNFIRRIINIHQPELIVGHNFKSDITVLESAYGDILPELYYYDDTMDLMEWSNLANIIGGYSLNKAITEVFDNKAIGLFSAYDEPRLLIEYGLKDALYPILLRHYIISGQLPVLNFRLKLDKILKEENRSFLLEDSFELSI